jgi:hypothetical protein
MRAGRLAVLALLVLALGGLAWWVLERDAGGSAADEALLLPGFAASSQDVDRIQVQAAGGEVIVEIVKRDGLWRMPDRQDWPANQREVSQALFRLGEARKLEAKTATPALHVRLGVEDVAAPEAKGAQLNLSGGGQAWHITVGKNHPALGGSYVRLSDQAQTWLLDSDIAPARNPVDWLDRRLLDIPLARIDAVRISPSGGRPFALGRRDDALRLDDVASAALADADAGNATGGFTDQLAFDDVAADAGTAALQTVEFESVEGIRVRVEAWTESTGTWARLSAQLDVPTAREWLAREPEAEAEDAQAPEVRLQAVEARVAEWQARFQGHQFLLPPFKAEHLMKARDAYLAEPE